MTRTPPLRRGATLPRLLMERPWQLVELSEHLGVGENQLRRDLSDLRAVGWPVKRQQTYAPPSDGSGKWQRGPRFFWIDAAQAQEEQRRAKAQAARDQRDREILDSMADKLNAEAADSLEFQASLDLIGNDRIEPDRTVAFSFGGKDFVGEVVDRQIRAGQRLVRVRFDIGADELAELELSEGDVRAVERKSH